MQLVKPCLWGLLFCLSVNAIAQNSGAPNSATKKVKGWQQGYVIMKESGDTLNGLVKKHSWMENPVEWVDFKIDTKGKKKLYRYDSITGFKYAEMIYNYYEHCGWSKLILRGTINVYKGFIYHYGFNGTVSKSPCMAFKKGQQQIKFISSDDTKILTGFGGGILKQQTKDSFKEFISDNPDLLAEFEQEKFRYEQLEDLIARYNNWAKDNTNKK